MLENKEESWTHAFFESREKQKVLLMKLSVYDIREDIKKKLDL